MATTTATTVATSSKPPALSGLGAVQPHVAKAAKLIAAQAGITKVHGWRAWSDYDPLGHPAGLAVDFPCSNAQGDVVANYAIANAEALSIKYLIWRQRMWTPAKGWKAMGDRGSASENHLDHVHISWKTTPSKLLDTLNPVNVGKTIGDTVGSPADTLGQITTALNPQTWAAEGRKLGLQLAGVAAGLTLVVLGVAYVSTGGALRAAQTAIGATS